MTEKDFSVAIERLKGLASKEILLIKSEDLDQIMKQLREQRKEIKQLREELKNATHEEGQEDQGSDGEAVR